MCGIFGIALRDRSEFETSFLESLVKDLFLLSESRGKEAAGIAILAGDTIQVHKQPTSASAMVRSRQFKSFFRAAANGINGDVDLNGHTKANGQAGSKDHAKANGQTDASGHASPGTGAMAILGHSRLVTNGLQSANGNNQPVIANGMVGVHNGIIVNDEALWATFPSLKRSYQVDTEVLLSILGKYQRECGNLVGAAQETFRRIKGSASIAVVCERCSELLLATNTGSLYFATCRKGNLCFFASERHMLSVFLQRAGIAHRDGECKIWQIKPNTGCVVNLQDLSLGRFALSEPIIRNGALPAAPRYKIVDLASRDEQIIQSMRRCTRCILPETMPFIEFDADGVCNYCHNYRKMEVRGHDALERILAKCRKSSGEPDCIAAFSGGRDSSYGLHYLKNVMGMNPIAYTYDWGMITDLGRRNQARVCGQLGIEQILISADIKVKRKNIRRNIHAWVRRPELGMVPLFMAGDKQFFYYANKLRKQLGIDLVIFCANPLERTGFKSGFCGVNEGAGAWYYNTSILNKLRLTGYYAKNFLRNPAYLNPSLVDSAFAYVSSFVLPHDYLLFYDYIRWDEQQIDSTLLDQYDWEKARDTATTWRIGDGTAAFYNYIYYTIAGFTESDTFRSNQVREGMLTREQAMEIARTENQPRFDSIQWYAQQIGFDCDEVLSAINAAPKLYRK